MKGGTPSVLDPKGHGASIIATEMWIQFAVGAAIFVLVVGLLGWILLVRSRRDPGERMPLDESAARRWVLLGGVAMPVVVLSLLVAVSARSLARLASPPSREVTTVEVIGHRWWWEVRYPDYAVTTANEIVLPAGRSVRLRVRSADVIHSLWIPQLQRKIDLEPGTWNTTWIRADDAGQYRGVCAEFCGESHALMQLLVEALPPDRWDAWVTHARAPATIPADRSEQLGEQVFLSTCAYCHTIEGTPAHGAVGPDLTHLASRRTIVSALLPNTQANLARWISGPQRVKPGALMPPFRLDDGRMRALLDFLESLQ